MWTKALVLEKAANIKTMEEWRANKALSSAASRLKIREEATKHIPRERVTTYSLTENEIIQLARQFTSRESFRKAYSSLYKKLTVEQLSELFGPPHSIKHKYSNDELIVEALKFKSRNELKLKNANVYNAIRLRNLQNLAFSHMDEPKCVKYTYEQLRKEALKYTSKQNFKFGNYGAYQASCRHERFKEICSHMLPNKIATNYDNPMWLYIVKIITLDNTLPIVYKIGITKRPYILDRFWIDYRKNKTCIEVLAKTKFTKGIDAYNLEQEFKLEFNKFKYTGVSPLINTKTSEMFTIDITSKPVGIGLRDCDETGEPLE